MSETVEVDFDHYSPEMVEGSRDFYKDLRGKCPVVHSPRHGGFYLVTGYDEIMTILKDPVTYSSAEPGGATIPPLPLSLGFLEMDPPLQTEYRRTATPLFSRTNVDALRPSLRELATACIDEFIEVGSFDVVGDLAEVVPMLMTLKLLGVPLNRADAYSQVFRAQSRGASGGPESFVAMLEDFGGFAAHGGVDPEGLINIWRHGEVNGETISSNMVVELIVMFLSGAVDTTASAISHTLLHLGRNPAETKAVAADPALLGRLVEEVLRVHPPATKLVRHVRREVQLGGVTLKPGDHLMLAVQSANEDIPGMADPQEIRLDRSGPTSPTLTFGHGVHRCIGARLAPVVIEIVVAAVLDRLPDFTIDYENVQRFSPSPLIDGFLSVPARFMPGARSGSRTLSEIVAGKGMSPTTDVSG